MQADAEEQLCTEEHRKLAVLMVDERWTEIRRRLEGRSEFDAYDYYCLVMALHRTGDPELAIRTGEEGHRKFPWDPGIVDRMMLPILRSGSYRRGLLLWRKTRGSLEGPRFPDAMANLVGNACVAYVELGMARIGVQELRGEFDRWESPLMAGNVACLYARAGDQETALAWVDRALLLGKPVSFFRSDPDLNALRGLPQFQTLLERDTPKPRGVSILDLHAQIATTATLAGLSWIIARRDALRGTGAIVDSC